MMNMTKAFTTNLNNLAAIYERSGFWADDMIEELSKKDQKSMEKIIAHLNKRAEDHGFKITKKEMKELLTY